MAGPKPANQATTSTVARNGGDLNAWTNGRTLTITAAVTRTEPAATA
jgi:hypothetical protein